MTQYLEVLQLNPFGYMHTIKIMTMNLPRYARGIASRACGSICYDRRFRPGGTCSNESLSARLLREPTGTDAGSAVKFDVDGLRHRQNSCSSVGGPTDLSACH